MSSSDKAHVPAPPLQAFLETQADNLDSLVGDGDP